MKIQYIDQLLLESTQVFGCRNKEAPFTSHFFGQKVLNNFRTDQISTD